ncbi:predicted protein [Nematostella vectensis]|uniref:LicD/FKTN/FKRP nucleotidyltransferase domain-containing protein n=2 Tax=Nematostella vectensis TaxID=45351 RepID=A7RW07_NEMVE|nr:predicted protein [Nematostella vectensis]|eukprot:XP_001636393.1 predicted protein [Nematostella vectensis]
MSPRRLFFVLLGLAAFFLLIFTSSTGHLQFRKHSPSKVKEHSVFQRFETLLDEANTRKRQVNQAKGENPVFTTRLPTTTEPPPTIPSVPSDNSGFGLTYIDVGNVVNANIERPIQGGFCSIPFRYGDMCPQSYTDIGGYCEWGRDKKSFACPDIRMNARLDHRQGQLVTTRMLRIFDLIARKHKLRYWLESGTMLGAARHKGNIPWDTDIDISMPLKDYVIFFNKAAQELPKDIFFQNSESDPALRPANYRSKRHQIIGMYKRPYNPRLRDRHSCYKYCIKHGCGWHDGMMIDIFVKDGDLSNAGIFPLKEIEFEGFIFPVPSTWNKMLEKSYGKNYMKVPKNEKDRRPVDFPDPLMSCDAIKLKKEQESRAFEY